MSMSYQPPGQGTAGATDIVTQLQNIARQLGLWARLFAGRHTFGTFTLSNAATTVVSQPAALANSFISLTPTNTHAADLMGGNKSLYLSAINPGVSFSVTTASGVAAVGDETFSYLITAPS